MQIEVISARFAGNNHSYYFSPNGLELKKGDKVVVETERGKDLVTIVKEKELIDASLLEDSLKNVLKVASQEEIDSAIKNQKIAEGYLSDIKKIVASLGLEMKVVSVESNFNLSKLTVNFTSENRVDFRELVKKLAEKYRVKIELRQIGPRDASRILGGFGPCGKEVCCHQGVGVCDHVSIKMAKNQGLSLNPNNISGLCNKLLCCLSYENANYVELLKIMPRVNTFVKTPDGEGKVIYCNLLQKKVDVRFADENSSEIKTYDVKDLKFKNE